MSKIAPPLHWRDLYDPISCRLVACRPPGAPAGSWPLTPWWHCMMHDPYERFNFWSHAIPAASFLGMLAAALANAIPGGVALATFCTCACITHALSALTHVYPDSHSIEKCDHIGIVFTIVGTAVTALMAQEHGHAPPAMVAIAAGLLVAACLQPVPRVTGFIVGGGLLVFLYAEKLLNALFVMELVLYVLGAAFFLRNSGHSRGIGLADHHLLHYFVTAASILHIAYILQF